MDLQQLRYFVAVAETQSVSRGALRCGVAQPTLSQQLRRLEARLGRRLFDRLARGVALTEAGHALLPRARRILAEVNAIVTSLADELEAGAGPLRLGAIPTMGPFLLPPLLRRFMRRYPRCELFLREDLTDRLVDALVDNELDLAIMSTPVDNEVIQLDVVGRERLLLAASPALKLPKGAVRLDDLRDQPAVVLHEMHCLGQQIESFCAARRWSRRIVCRSTQLPLVQQLVALGFGISLVPEMCARTDAARARRYESLGDDGPTREIAVAYRVDRTLSARSRDLIAMLRDDLARGRHAYV